MANPRRIEKAGTQAAATPDQDYPPLFAEVCTLVEQARHATARAANSAMTRLYWHIGRVIIEREQGGKRRAGYGETLRARLAADLTGRFGRGFSRQNLDQMCRLFLGWRIGQTASGKSGRALQEYSG